MVACVTKPRAVTKLNDGLVKLTRAPLKPQQRLYILRVHLIPKLYHELILGGIETTKSLLSRLDKMTRSSIHSWLHLPHDVPISMFHASARDGELNILQLLYVILIQKIKLIDRIMSIEPERDPVL